MPDKFRLMESFANPSITFQKRPYPISVEYRPMYKISIIVLILKICCRSETSSLLKFHLLSWSLTSDSNTLKLREYVESDFKTDFSVWGIEPALNRALQLAIAENICEIVGGKSYRLTAKGNKLFKLIKDDAQLFEREKKFLNFLGKNIITDSRINTMSKGWSLSYVEN